MSKPAGRGTSLRPGGRLALILPAELLQVSYASQLRSFLVDRFAKIDIITCNELFFKNAEPRLCTEVESVKRRR